jgi:hypothetical protein
MTPDSSALSEQVWKLLLGLQGDLDESFLFQFADPLFILTSEFFHEQLPPDLFPGGHFRL